MPARVNLLLRSVAPVQHFFGAVGLPACEANTPIYRNEAHSPPRPTRAAARSDRRGARSFPKPHGQDADAGKDGRLRLRRRSGETRPSGRSEFPDPRPSRGPCPIIRSLRYHARWNSRMNSPSSLRDSFHRSPTRRASWIRRFAPPTPARSSTA